jgi:hypothetical protein
VVKDIHSAKSLEEAAKIDPVWELPPDGYFELQRAIQGASARFPLLHSVCAHDEGPDGDFAIPPDQADEFLREIDLLLGTVGVTATQALKGMLYRLAEFVRKARKANLTIFGVAD